MERKQLKYDTLSDEEKEYIMANHQGIGFGTMVNLLFEKFNRQHYKKQLQTYYKKNNLSTGLSVGSQFTTNKELSKQEEEYILANYKGTSASKMAKLLSDIFNTKHSSNQINKFYKDNNLDSGIIGRSPYLALNQQEKDYIIKNHKGTTVENMTKQLYEQFGIEHSPGQVRTIYYKNNLDSGLTGRYEKGRTSENKGKKLTDMLTHEQIADMRKKQKIAVSGKNNAKYKPVGSTYISSRGDVIEKIAEPNTWQRQHIVVWEKANGKLPEGSVIIHIDGDKTNNDISNLRLATQAEAAYMYNGIGISEDAQINDAIYHVARLNMATRNKEKKDEEEWSKNG